MRYHVGNVPGAPQGAAVARFAGERPSQVGERVSPAFFIHTRLRPMTPKANAVLRQDIEHELARLGYDLVDIEWAGHTQRPVIRVRVERSSLDRPVTLGDCVSVSRSLEGWLEESQRVAERYVLEVSSPGLDRPLTRDGDFERFSGRRIEVKGTFGDRVARHRARLVGLVEDGSSEMAIRLRLSGGEQVDIPRALVQTVRLSHDWKDPR